jgi:hypothetical protein
MFEVLHGQQKQSLAKQSNGLKVHRICESQKKERRERSVSPAWDRHHCVDIELSLLISVYQTTPDGYTAQGISRNQAYSTKTAGLSVLGSSHITFMFSGSLRAREFLLP